MQETKQEVTKVISLFKIGRKSVLCIQSLKGFKGAYSVNRDGIKGDYCIYQP